MSSSNMNASFSSQQGSESYCSDLDDVADGSISRRIKVSPEVIYEESDEDSLYSHRLSQ